MITSTTLQLLNLSSNGLTGELPLLSGSCAVLDLSNNQFEGNLSRIIKWGNIEFLDLSHNRLTGPIPEETPQFVRLNHLNLSYNSFIGSLPKVLTQYLKLGVLDLSFNQLEGPFLPDLLSVPTLQELYLQENSLTGLLGLPSTTSSLGPNLRALDLSHNQFDGYLPDNIGSLTGLQFLDLAGNNLSGSLPTSMVDLISLSSLDISQNNFTGAIPSNLSSTLQSFNASYNNLSGTIPESLRNFPRSSFFPGNEHLELPPGSSNTPEGNSRKRPSTTVFKVVIIIACVLAFLILILIAIFLHYIRTRGRKTEHPTSSKNVRRWASSNPSSQVSAGAHSGGALLVSAGDLVASRKGSTSHEIVSPDEKLAVPVASGFSPSKNSHTSWSPESGDSLTAENLGRLDVRSPDRLIGELHFLDDSINLTPEELSRAPAEVLGRSSHGTSYRATLDNGVFLTVKWLREGVAKQRKEFAKEARKFANIRHPNVVCLRGYYWGPTQHEKLILSDYISPGSLASFLYGMKILSASL